MWTNPLAKNLIIGVGNFFKGSFDSNFRATIRLTLHNGILIENLQKRRLAVKVNYKHVLNMAKITKFSRFPETTINLVNLRRT